MTPSEFLSTVLDPGIIWCQSVPGWTVPFDDRARLMLLAIPGQESAWRNVAQAGGGPGVGPYQFEPETCDELLINAASRPMMHAIATALGIATGELDGAAFYDRIINDTRLAVALARLDLFCDPHSLPAISDQDGSWRMYLRVWRPGKPKPSAWAKNYKAAMSAIKGTAP
jgi:hypothetical protein